MGLDLNRKLHNLSYCKPQYQLTQDHMGLIRSAFQDVTVTIHHLCGDTRESALAQTAIEEACMWAIASLARNEQGGN